MERFSYTLKRSRRARRYTMAIKNDGRVVLTAPIRASAASIESFAKESAPWLEKKLLKLKAYKTFPPGTGTARHFKKYKEEARKAITERVRHFNHFYNFQVNGISIRNQSSRWGSCSKSKNLNFNYRLFFLPAELTDYVVVHELCHLREMNHSSRFWALVEKAVPDYKARRRLLRRYRLI